LLTREKIRLIVSMDIEDTTFDMSDSKSHVNVVV